jgi:transcriptional regulator with XRE-family HTH domain
MALAQHIDPPTDATELGSLIRHARERAGLRQTDLAAAVHVGLSTYAAWERGVHDVPADVLPLLARALKVTFVVDADGYRTLEAAPAPAPAPPQVVVIVVSTPEAAEAAVRAALDRAGTPRAE